MSGLGALEQQVMAALWGQPPATVRAVKSGTTSRRRCWMSTRRSRAYFRPGSNWVTGGSRCLAQCSQ